MLLFSIVVVVVSTKYWYFIFDSGQVVFFLSYFPFSFFFQASAHNKNLDVGANIFIGNLDPEIDEKLLYDTFSAFGVILQTPKVHCKYCFY